MLLIFGAIGFSLSDWVSLAIVLVFPTAALLYRILVEEMALTESFGEDYVEYTKATRRRLVPGLLRYHPNFRPSASFEIETQGGRLPCPVLDDEVQEWT